MKTVRFGLIGCGLMGKEFACAVARWCQLSADMPKPVIVGVCDLSEDARRYFTDNFDTVKYAALPKIFLLKSLKRKMRS